MKAITNDDWQEKRGNRFFCIPLHTNKSIRMMGFFESKLLFSSCFQKHPIGIVNLRFSDSQIQNKVNFKLKKQCFSKMLKKIQNYWVDMQKFQDFFYYGRKVRKTGKFVFKYLQSPENVKFFHNIFKIKEMLQVWIKKKYFVCIKIP